MALSIRWSYRRQQHYTAINNTATFLVKPLNLTDILRGVSIVLTFPVLSNNTNVGPSPSSDDIRKRDYLYQLPFTYPVNVNYNTNTGTALEPLTIFSDDGIVLTCSNCYATGPTFPLLIPECKVDNILDLNLGPTIVLIGSASANVEGQIEATAGMDFTVAVSDSLDGNTFNPDNSVTKNVHTPALTATAVGTVSVGLGLDPQ
ncbi:hypothetical protein BDK51DRAFT_48735 [Blyttiomyces helicus]|uniref:Uncharacterized protein n=1 Tax=Blyttiomyces helicus TaxID=388810 RepID=A0A4P9W2Q9_9FUNG|nr:hypothetical protein BDK51DRAFT_48735 [Blyttiomyces helicus]|eukprot:RKO84890.1 hypothetical protein BDK51DRAFT_48735 [Blyttiomyces helicus]